MAHRLKDAIPALNDLIKKSIKLSPGPPERYCLQTTRSNLDMEGKIRRWTFGQKHAKMRKKTILLVGETGTGKTTLINTMVNYYLGVKFEDKVWFEITEEEQQDQSEIQTNEVTAYEIISEEKRSEEESFFLTIIDTPGFGDTRGINQDMKIPQNLLKIFQQGTGVKDLDAVCLVLKASENRISDEQRYIFEGVLSLFGKDIEDIIVLLLTHSDGEHPMNILEAVQKEGIPCCKDNYKPVHFLFNNRQAEKILKKYEHVSEESWKMGEISMEEFFKFLNSRPRKSVDLTVSVLKKRMHLEACVQSMKKHIKFREEKEGELSQIQATLKKYKETIEKEENSPFTVTTVYKEIVDVTDTLCWDRKVTSCKSCEENCHEFGCWIAPTAQWCCVMKGDHCTMCKCHYSKHVRESRKYVLKEKKEIVTFKDLKTKYSSENEGGVNYDKNALKNTSEETDQLLKLKEEMRNQESKLKKHLDENENEKRSVKEAYEAIIKLSMIALRPDSVFTLQYLNFLIPRVEEAGEAEWTQALRKMQTDAEKESTKSVVKYLDWMRSKTGPKETNLSAFPN